MDTDKDFIDLLFEEMEYSEIILYSFIMVSIIWFFTKVKVNFSQVSAIIAGTLIVYHFSRRKHNELSKDRIDLEYKLGHIRPLPMYFYKDPEIIELIYSILHFKNYNEPSFITMINSIDNFLKIKDDIEKGVLHVKENMDVAKDFLRKSLESLHSFVYSIPVVKLYNDILQVSLKRLHLLLRRHLDEMYNIGLKQYNSNKINVDTQFLYNEGPNSNDSRFKNNRHSYY